MATFNEVLKKGAQNIGDVADNILSSQFVKNVIPTGEGLRQEVGTYIGSNAAIKARYIQDELAGAVKRSATVSLNKAGLSTEDIGTVTSEIAQAMQGTDYSDAALDTLAEIMQRNSVEGEAFERFKQNASAKVKSAMDNAPLDHISFRDGLNAEGMKHPLRYAEAYFNNPDKKIKKQRIAAVAGTYAGVAVGARYLSGGNLTHDEYGQKNIAGIPFI